MRVASNWATISISLRVTQGFPKWSQDNDCLNNMREHRSSLPMTCFRSDLIASGLVAWLRASSVSVAQGSAGIANQAEHEPVDPITVEKATRLGILKEHRHEN